MLSLKLAEWFGDERLVAECEAAPDRDLCCLSLIECHVGPRQRQAELSVHRVLVLVLLAVCELCDESLQALAKAQCLRHLFFVCIFVKGLLEQGFQACTE